MRPFITRKNKSLGGCILAILVLSVHADCEWAWIGVCIHLFRKYWSLQTYITDLVTPTPLTYTWTAGVYDCSKSPTTLTDWDTIIHSKTSYTALPVICSFTALAEAAFFAYTYPDLIVTNIKPGDTLTFVSFLFGIVLMISWIITRLRSTLGLYPQVNLPSEYSTHRWL